MEDYEDQIKYVCSHCGTEYDKKADCIDCIRNCVTEKDYDTVTNVYRLSACFCGTPMRRLPRWLGLRTSLTRCTISMEDL